MNRLSVAELLNGTIAVARRNSARFSIIAGVFIFLPAIVYRILFPEMLNFPIASTEVASEPQLPAAFWPYMIVFYTTNAFGIFTIAAVSADPAEGSDRTMGAIIRSTLPAIGKAILAGLLFMFLNLVIAVFLSSALNVAAHIVAATYGELSNADASGTASFVVVGLVLVQLPVLAWMTARLSPLVGVYLAEDIGIVDGIVRAWALSKGSAWPILLLMLILSGTLFALSAAHYALAMAGLVTGLQGFVAGVVLVAISAVLFVYQSSALGYLYRHLATVRAG